MEFMLHACLEVVCLLQLPLCLSPPVPGSWWVDTQGMHFGMVGPTLAGNGFQPRAQGLCHHGGGSRKCIPAPRGKQRRADGLAKPQKQGYGGCPRSLQAQRSTSQPQASWDSWDPSPHPWHGCSRPASSLRLLTAVMELPQPTPSLTSKLLWWVVQVTSSRLHHAPIIHQPVQGQKAGAGCQQQRDDNRARVSRAASPQTTVLCHCHPA